MTEQTRILDHAEARRLAALAVDGLLDAPDRSTLDAHLAVCPACRAVATAMDRDAEALRTLDLGPVPVAVRAERGHRRGAPRARRVGRSLGGHRRGRRAAHRRHRQRVIGGAGGPGRRPRPGRRMARRPRTPFRTRSPGRPTSRCWPRRASACRPATRPSRAGRRRRRSISDPGDATYRTLEATWLEHGRGDAPQPLFRGRCDLVVGQRDPRLRRQDRPEGRVDDRDRHVVPTPDRAAVDRRHRRRRSRATARHRGQPPPRRRRRSSTVPWTTSPSRSAVGMAVGENDRPFASGGKLHCSGILQMTPARTRRRRCSSLGYRLSWRRITTTGPNTGLASRRCRTRPTA